MTFLYNLSISVYRILIHLASAFGNQKARLWIHGRRNMYAPIAAALTPDSKVIWIHASSLGEFEQGRPVIEKFHDTHTDYKIVLTFFSPSGFEIRKNYQGADLICYLPLDTQANAQKFIDHIHPEIAIFIKYEFWYHYINTLKQRHIPLYLISSNFRENQHFFSWYGGWFRQLLAGFEHIFVQNEKSARLLETIGIKQVTIAGDTRFDRVSDIAAAAKELPLVRNFVGDKPCIIAGSSWEPDEQLLTQFLNNTSLPVRMIFAPHEIDESHIQSLIQKINRKVIRYSQLILQPDQEADVMIIDNIGMLSSLYRYGQIAYIGGGFGKGIHNILEAATFGLPVIFGPNYLKFQEAIDLISAGGAFTIQNLQELSDLLNTLLHHPAQLAASGEISRNFVSKNCGATHLILKHILK